MRLRKLYGKMRKRQAKKLIGSERRWKKLLNGLKLQPGDLVSACRGYNERIAEITPDIIHAKGWAIIDFSIQTVSGCFCSLIHCCTFPLKTKEEIIAYFKGWGSPQAVAWCEAGGWSFSKDPMVVGVMEGKDIFDEHGEPYYEYCNLWERVDRYPDRFREETFRQAQGLTPKERGKASGFDDAYLEGWASYVEVWPDEDNPYPPYSQMHSGYRGGRQHAQEIAYARPNSPAAQDAGGLLPGG